MKTKITTLILATTALLSVNAQVVFQEDFTATFNPATTGWNIQNLSASANPTLAWFQGNSNAFSAYNGGPNDYYACNFNNTTDANPATISSWLITPTLNLVNGGQFQFATRTTTNPSPFPDRLEVYMSTAGNGTNVGTTPVSLGTFSTLLVSVNPSLTSTGYPGTWTVYTATISGLSGPTLGRVGFRYFVTNGGPAANAPNSDYIGVDGVKYMLPCGVTVQSYTTCAGVTTTLTALGGDATTTYTWAPVSGSGSAIVVSPGTTTNYTVAYSSGGSPCPSQTAAITIGNQLSMSITASSTSVCIGSAVTLTVNGSATSYSWNTGATSTVITSTITANTTFSVGGLNGLCVGGNTIAIAALPIPTLSAVASPSISCPDASVSVTGSGAASYIWVLGGSGSTSNPVTISTSTNPSGGTFTLGLVGIGANGCSTGGILTLTVAPSPTVNANVTKPTICINSTNTLTASGADSYAWSGAGTSGTNPYNFTAGATAGIKQFTVIGTSSVSGCTGSTTASFSVSLCTGIEKNEGDASQSNVFPNPFTNQLNISGFNGPVEVYNMLGEKIISLVSGSSETINTAELPKGLYILKAYTASGETERTLKLLKN